MDLKDFQDHLDTRFDRLEARFDQHENKLDNHLERLSKAEEAIVWLRGHVKIVTTVGLTVAGTIISVLAKYFFKIGI